MHSEDSQKFLAPNRRSMDNLLSSIASMKTHPVEQSQSHNDSTTLPSINSLLRSVASNNSLSLFPSNNKVRRNDLPNNRVL